LNISESMQNYIQVYPMNMEFYRIYQIFPKRFGLL
jgi:hypothetical protein